MAKHTLKAENISCLWKPRFPPVPFLGEFPLGKEVFPGVLDKLKAQMMSITCDQQQRNQRETDSFLVNGEWNSHFWGKEENNRRNRVSSWEAWKQDQVQIEEGFRRGVLNQGDEREKSFGFLHWEGPVSVAELIWFKVAWGGVCPLSVLGSGVEHQYTPLKGQWLQVIQKFIT